MIRNSFNEQQRDILESTRTVFTSGNFKVTIELSKALKN